MGVLFFFFGDMDNFATLQTESVFMEQEHLLWPFYIYTKAFFLVI